MARQLLSKKPVDVDLVNCAARLRAGKKVSDKEFDSVYGERERAISFRHWTPVTVACRAARLLTEMGATRILDIGAGVGKFCIVGALTTEADYCGVERRGNLVETARSAAERFRARAKFVHANIVDFETDPFNGFYVYNPFQEQLAYDPLPIDETIEPSRDLYRSYVASTIAKLSRARAGSAVVTFNGLGGPMPPQYRRVSTENHFDAELVLWVKRADARTIAKGPSSDSVWF